MERQTPIFIVASARPRLGKTLLARVLTEFFLADGRSAAAFDVNPDDFALVEYLPAFTAVASVSDTRSQVVLFDQLVVADEVPKIIDLGHAAFDQFFGVMENIAFAREAQRQSIVPVVLFIADGDRRSRHSYELLHDRFADLVLVPVINEAVSVAARYRDNFPTPTMGGAPLTIPALAAVIKTVIERPGFSFAAYATGAADPTTELYGWIRRVFLEFRELELRLLLQQIRPSLQFQL